MLRPNEIDKEKQTMTVLVKLTGVFEGIASMRIAQIRSQVLQSTQFFHSLWHIYTQLRVDDNFHFGRTQTKTEVINKELYLIITAEGGFSGDIDHRLIEIMLQTYDPAKHEIIVLGHHGAIQLAQRGVSFKKYYKLPTNDRTINVAPLANDVRLYRSTRVFYQVYISLMKQEVRQIALATAVQEEGRRATAMDEMISEANYIFEPSTTAVVDHLENSMMQIALAQVILESRLAQYASRFGAMSAAQKKSEESQTTLQLSLNRARRAVKDERLKEVINGLRKVRLSI